NISKYLVIVHAKDPNVIESVVSGFEFLDVAPFYNLIRTLFQLKPKVLRVSVEYSIRVAIHACQKHFLRAAAHTECACEIKTDVGCLLGCHHEEIASWL